VLLQPQTDALLGNERDEAVPILTAGWLSAVGRNTTKECLLLRIVETTGVVAGFK